MRDEADLAPLLRAGASNTVRGAARDASRSPLATRLTVGVDAAGTARASLRAALRSAQRQHKGPGPEGAERLIAPAQRARLQRLLASAPAPVLTRLAADLQRLDGPTASLGRALYLKASAARLPALLGADADARGAALDTLRAFAARLTGMSRPQQRAACSVLDLDSRRSTSAFDPLAWDERRGVIHARGDGDRRTDNDGLFQRFLGSCGTTTLQMALCEEDPVRALVVHDAGLHRAVDDDVVGRFQAELLRSYGSAALGRRASYDRGRLHHALARLRRRGDVTRAQAEALRAHVDRGRPLDAPGARALGALRAWLRGFPDDDAIAAMQRDPQRGSDGLEIEKFGAMVAQHLAPVTGRTYDTLSLERGLAGDAGQALLDRAERVLQAGLDVPFGIDEPGHYLFMSAVRRADGERQWLVSDPWGGTTCWIPERDLISGRFIESPLDLAAAGEGGQIDCLCLAREPA